MNTSTSSPMALEKSPITDRVAWAKDACHLKPLPSRDKKADVSRITFAPRTRPSRQQIRERPYFSSLPFFSF